MLRQFVITAVFAFSICAHADSLMTEQDAKSLAEQVMAKASKGDLDAAFSVMKPYAAISETEFQSMALQSKSQRDQFGVRYGNSIGYEFIRETKAGNSLLKLIYIEKTVKHALPWMFIFYKTPGGWVLNSFAWNDQIQSAFSE